MRCGIPYGPVPKIGMAREMRKVTSIEILLRNNDCMSSRHGSPPARNLSYIDDD